MTVKHLKALIKKHGKVTLRNRHWKLRDDGVNAHELVFGNIRLVITDIDDKYVYGENLQRQHDGRKVKLSDHSSSRNFFFDSAVEK